MRMRRIKSVMTIIGVTAGIYLGIRYLLPLVIPFLIAFLTALVIEPSIEKAHRKTNINKGVLTAGLLLLAGGLFGALLWFLCGKLLSQIRYLLNNFWQYEKQFGYFVNDCCENIEGVFGFNAERLEKIVLKNVNIFIENLQIDFLPNLMSNSVQYVKIIVGGIGIAIIMLIAVILLVNDYKKMIEFNKRFFYYQELRNLSKRVLRVGAEYLKAQMIIMIVIAGICTVALLLLKNPYALLIGTVIGLLDALPILGTGIVLIPWAIVYLVRGEFLMALAFLGLSALCNLTREFLEPKLVGGSLGIHPVMVLATVYVGIRLFGITGVATGPMGYMLGREIVAEIFEKTGLSME